MRHSIFSIFKNLSINWEKCVFYFEKWDFDPIGNSEHTRKFLDLRKALLIFLPLYLLMLKMQKSAQP